MNQRHLNEGQYPQSGESPQSQHQQGGQNWGSDFTQQPQQDMGSGPQSGEAGNYYTGSNQGFGNINAPGSMPSGSWRGSGQQSQRDFGGGHGGQMGGSGFQGSSGHGAGQGQFGGQPGGQFGGQSGSEMSGYGSSTYGFPSHPQAGYHGTPGSVYQTGSRQGGQSGGAFTGHYGNEPSETQSPFNPMYGSESYDYEGGGGAFPGAPQGQFGQNRNYLSQYGQRGHQGGFQEGPYSGGGFQGQQRYQGFQGGQANPSFGQTNQFQNRNEQGGWQSARSPGLPQGGQQSWGQQHHDPDYHEWRNAQMRRFDEDYNNWRQERFQRFSDEFEQWRQSRNRQGASDLQGMGGQHGDMTNAQRTSATSATSTTKSRPVTGASTQEGPSTSASSSSHPTSQHTGTSSKSK